MSASIVQYCLVMAAKLCNCFAQVHRATLHTGESVVVKVQRPGLRNLFDIDMSNLKILAKQMDRTDENNDFL